MKTNKDKYSYLNSILNEAEQLWKPGNKKKDYQKIINLYTEIIEIDSDFKDALERRGVAYRQAKLYDQSIADFMQCFSQRPGSPRFLRLAGEVQYLKHDYESALLTLTRVLQIDSNDIYCTETRAKVYRKLGMKEEAKADEKVVKEYYEAEQKKWDDPNHYYHYK